MEIQFGYAIVYVNSVQDTVAFWERAFGFTGSFIHESNLYGELQTGSTKMAFTSHELAASAVPTSYRRTESEADPLGVEFTLITPDVDAAWKRAVAAGARDAAAPHDTPWGQRVAYVRDANGFLVGIATPMG